MTEHEADAIRAIVEADRENFRGKDTNPLDSLRAMTVAAIETQGRLDPDVARYIAEMAVRQIGATLFTEPGKVTLPTSQDDLELVLTVAFTAASILAHYAEYGRIDLSAETVRAAIPEGREFAVIVRDREGKVVDIGSSIASLIVNLQEGGMAVNLSPNATNEQRFKMLMALLIHEAQRGELDIQKMANVAAQANDARQRPFGLLGRGVSDTNIC